jgi:hypothetical protein
MTPIDEHEREQRADIVRSTTAMLANAAKVATKMPVRIVPTYGVLKRGVPQRREQTVAGHGHEDARLPGLEDQQDAAHRDPTPSAMMNRDTRQPRRAVRVGQCGDHRLI